jgi:hypothetical protein
MSINKNSMVSDQNRRDFIKHLSLGSSAIILSPLLTRCGQSGDNELYKRFLEPSSEAKPFFRWWWNGNRLSKDEIERELELMQEAGIGGIEINPIQMPDQAENLVGKEVKWLSDEWIDYLEFTIEKAKDLGMVTDLIVGTGWPFGGEFLSPDETIQGLKVESVKVTGPEQKEITLPKTEDGFSAIKSITLFPASMADLAEGKEIKANDGQRTVTVEIPEGEHILLMLIWQNNFRSVMHGAPGGAGPVLDHFNKEAVIKYLNHMSDAIKRRTGKKILEGIRAMFCDSIELNGANWTHGFDEIFKDRRGYDLLPYLPLLLSSEITIDAAMDDELKRARYDYSLTLSEVFMESFILPFHNWCHDNGTLSRYQAYGHPWLYTDLIEGYLVPDIPEGDQWLFNGGWQPHADVNQIRYAIWNKYASSAGHLAKRKIISTEAMTNTAGVFKASLKYIKQATDLNVATGINHLVLHGFNYSPPEAGFPGWVRYGCYFNDQNPWWQYMPIWSNYAARLSQVFQDSAPVSQVAIAGPTLDIWSNNGLDRNPFNLEPWYLHALWQALNHTGYGSDYINANLLNNIRLEDGKLVIGQMTYEVLLLCDIETMQADVANHLEMLALQGARIVMIGKKPYRSPAMLGALKQNGIVVKAIESALHAGILTAPSPDNLNKDKPVELMKWAQELMNNCAVRPSIDLSNPGTDLFHIHHQYNNSDIVFLTNMSETKTYSTKLSLGNQTKYACNWHIKSGEKIKLDTDQSNQLNISLLPLESILIVFDPNDQKRKVQAQLPVSGKKYEISVPWEVTLNSVVLTESVITIEGLEPINEIAGFENFGGEIIYKCQFENDEDKYTFLELDEVYETAEIRLNGKMLGLSWWGNNRFELGGALRKGRNKLEIKVTTLLANYCKSLKDNKTAQIWTSRYTDKSPVKCGLVGKVQLL